MVTCKSIGEIFLAFCFFGIANGELQKTTRCYKCIGEPGSNCATGIEPDKIDQTVCDGFCASATLLNGTVSRFCWKLIWNLKFGEGPPGSSEEFEDNVFTCMKESVGHRSCTRNAINDHLNNYANCIVKHGEDFAKKHVGQTAKNDVKLLKENINQFLKMSKFDVKASCVCTNDLCNADDTLTSGISQNENFIVANVLLLAVLYNF